MKKWAGALLISNSGEVILQERDNKLGVVNQGMITLFGGSVEEENVEDCLKREVEEELSLRDFHFEFFKLYQKRKATHGEDCDCYVYIIRDVDVRSIHVNEGRGYVLVSSDYDRLGEKLSLVTMSVLHDYFGS
ncbi:MAG: NUDIX domain-containing protein [Patescibacteria group bacterium]